MAIRKVLDESSCLEMINQNVLLIGRGHYSGANEHKSEREIQIGLARDDMGLMYVTAWYVLMQPTRKHKSDPNNHLSASNIMAAFNGACNN